MDTQSLATGILSNSFAVKKGLPIIRKMLPLIAAHKPFYSFEYFPPKTREGVENLYDRLDRMSQLEPLFMDLTWGAGGSTADLTLEISGNGQQMCSGEIMMHLTCTNLPQGAGVRGAGEGQAARHPQHTRPARRPPARAPRRGRRARTASPTPCRAGQRYIRRSYGDFFGVAVAGYPEGHVSAQVASTTTWRT